MMATETDATEEKDIFIKQKAGAEDLMFGLGTTSQVREGDNVTLSLINADTIPYDSTRSVKDVLDALLASSALST